MKLFDYLLSQGETQSAFARRAGVSRQLITEIIHQDRTPQMKNAKKIIEATGGKVSSRDLGLLK